MVKPKPNAKILVRKRVVPLQQVSLLNGIA